MKSDRDFLEECLSEGKDFAGVLTFRDLAYALQRGRHALLSCYRTAGPGSYYEVVLKAKH